MGREREMRQSVAQTPRGLASAVPQQPQSGVHVQRGSGGGTEKSQTGRVKPSESKFKPGTRRSKSKNCSKIQKPRKKKTTVREKDQLRGQIHCQCRGGAVLALPHPDPRDVQTRRVPDRRQKQVPPNGTGPVVLERTAQHVGGVAVHTGLVCLCHWVAVARFCSVAEISKPLVR